LIAKVFQYSFAQARTKAMKGNLLDSEDWYYLTKMRSLDEVARYLSATTYSRVLSSHRLAGFDEIPTLLRGFYEELFNDYGRLLKVVPARGRELLKSLLSRYEAENLKIILRGIWSGSSLSRTKSLLYPLQRVAQLSVDELLQAREVSDAADLLKQTIFHVPFLQAMPHFRAQGRLFPLEVGVDTAAFEHIVRVVKSFKLLSRDEAPALVGELIDGVNLGWIVRLRHFYGLSPEETINYTLSGGYHLGLHDLGSLARATDLSSFVAALPDVYREAVGHAGRWPAISILFHRWFVSQLHKTFRKNPFQIGLQMSYLLLKEMEVKSLESLVYAIELAESPEKVAELVCFSVKGAAGV
jgi:V/A-type H+/Na+-transporting ATPase subunit C